MQGLNSRGSPPSRSAIVEVDVADHLRVERPQAKERLGGDGPAAKGEPHVWAEVLVHVGLKIFGVYVVRDDGPLIPALDAPERLLDQLIGEVLKDLADEDEVRFRSRRGRGIVHAEVVVEMSPPASIVLDQRRNAVASDATPTGAADLRPNVEVTAAKIRNRLGGRESAEPTPAQRRSESSSGVRTVGSWEDPAAAVF